MQGVNGSTIYTDLQNTTINRLNIMPVSNTLVTPGNPTVMIVSLKEINHLNIQKRNIVGLQSNIKVNQSMQLQGDCLDGDRLQVSGYGAAKQIIIPTYNTTDFIIDRVRLQNIFSSGGQTYITSASTDLGGNTGIDFTNSLSSASRDLYWIGGQGSWNDLSHWSLTSGGSPITGCGAPRPNDNVFFDQNSGFTPTLNQVMVDNFGGQSASANNVTFSNAPNTPVLKINSVDNSYNVIPLYVYGNLTLQSDMKVVFQESSYNSLYYPIRMQNNSVSNAARYIDTKGIYVNITFDNTIPANVELLSAYKGSLYSFNSNSFKTNNYPMTLTRLFFQNINSANTTLDFGQSVITGIQTSSTGSTLYTDNFPQFYVNSGNNTPVTIIASQSKIMMKIFEIPGVPNASSFGEVTIWKDGIVNTGSTAHNYEKLTFLGSSNTSTSSTLSSPGNYKTLYFNPGTYTIASGQNVSENLFMTGTPCNRINVSRTAASGQSTINLDPAANYTMFYASVKDINFSRPVSAYGNSQDLGNTTNLTIVPTNVQAAGFGGNKTLCASEFPKTYDAAALFGTDPNASYTWTRLGTGVISTSPTVTFTQPGSYSVSVTYSQDGCNITENFTITSVALPVDNTALTTTSVLVQPTGDVVVTFKGSLTNQTYIFTYNINNGADIEITSNANGVATINHPRNVAGTFVYHLKGVRFASGLACSVAISNKDIVVNINPDCTTPGVVQLYGNELRGCTVSAGARRLAELSSITIANPTVDANVIQLVPGTGIVVKEGTGIFLLRNRDALPETLTLPANKPYIQGAIIYHNDRFYEGVENGKWVRIDND
ncbi:MAG: hypothetical protein P0Y62_06340 [Candidatus Chryseobacterium colombiense]|nr:hypothetical protein [Chryseobacterium sp.]WEK71172.1 MAG: hypothetical protein P0Y62_06340 [Chryseobacterium sp.]